MPGCSIEKEPYGIENSTQDKRHIQPELNHVMAHEHIRGAKPRGVLNTTNDSDQSDQGAQN